MKRFKQIILILILGLFIIPLFTVVKAQNSIDIHFFHSDTCSGCAHLDDYFVELLSEHDNLNLIYYDIYDPEDYQIIEKTVEAFDIPALTPTVVIGGLAFQGYSDFDDGAEIKANIEAAIEHYSEGDYVDVVKKIIAGDELLASDFDHLNRDSVYIPIIGEVEIASVSLLSSSIILGFLDGFNPCAMWILLFLISMLISMQDRKKMWIIGSTFIFVSGLVYAVIIFLFYSITKAFLDTSFWFRIAIGVFALIFGFYNLYKYFRDRNRDIGCDVTDETRRNKLSERIKKIVNSRNLFIALIAVSILAIIVNIIELACSTVYPLIFSSLLTFNDLPWGMSLIYILIYIFFFLIDDIIVFTIAVFTLNISAISNRFVKYSTIVGGILMLIIGVLLIFFPNIIMFNI